MDKSNENIDHSNYDLVLSAFERLAAVSPKSKSWRTRVRKQVCSAVSDLFPAFNNKGDNDKYLTDYQLEEFGYCRALGLSLKDTAYRLQMSFVKLQSLMSGEGLSLDKFVELVKRELFAKSELKQRLLRDIEQSSGTTNWKTSLALLEKLYPEEFGAKTSKVEDETPPVWEINIVDPVVKAEEKEDAQVSGD